MPHYVKFFRVPVKKRFTYTQCVVYNRLDVIEKEPMIHFTILNFQEESNHV